MRKTHSSDSPIALSAPEGSKIVQQLLKPETFASQSWWKELNTREQNTVMRETLEIGAAFMTWGEIKHEVGKRLAAVQEVLAPHNLFNPYLRVWSKLLNRSRRSFYRDIENYEKATAFPEAVARAAAIKNFPIEKLKTVRKMLPLPREASQSETQALKYVEEAKTYLHENPQIVQMDVMEIPVDDEEMMQETLRQFKNALLKLPSRKKQPWARKLLGMQLTVMGISSPITLEPEAVPAEFVRGRGRPAGKTIEGEASVQ